MATLKQRMRRKNSSGTYDTVHLESESGMILRPSGRTVEQDLAAYLPEYQNSDDVPKSLDAGKILITPNHAYIKYGDTIRDLTQDTDTVYTHPTDKQCNYSPDLSGYATVSSVNDLKTSVSNGKTLVANAITGKGVATSSSASFATMASNIGSIPTISSAFNIQYLDDPVSLVRSAVGFPTGSVGSTSTGTCDWGNVTVTLTSGSRVWDIDIDTSAAKADIRILFGGTSTYDKLQYPNMFFIKEKIMFNCYSYNGGVMKTWSVYGTGIYKYNTSTKHLTVTSYSGSSYVPLYGIYFA